MSKLPDLRRAARMAYRVLAARQIASLPVDPLPILRSCRDTKVMTCLEAADQLGASERDLERLFGVADAVTLRDGSGGREQYIILYRPGGNPARLRFTLAHELGHRLLGHTGAAPAEEREADHFASHLLCPDPVLARLRERFGDLHAEQVASACYVSLSCATLLSQRPPFPQEDPLYTQVYELLQSAVDTARAVSPMWLPHSLSQNGE